MSEASWSMVFAEESINDLLPITDYLTQFYCDFGEPPPEANRHAQVRIEVIIAAVERLVTAPLCGEFHDDLLPVLRHLALDRALYWFRSPSEAREILVSAVFFGATGSSASDFGASPANSCEV